MQRGAQRGKPAKGAPWVSDSKDPSPRSPAALARMLPSLSLLGGKALLLWFTYSQLDFPSKSSQTGRACSLQAHPQLYQRVSFTLS